jgi:hypothetical protein
MTERAAAEPTADTTDDCAEFEVGPVIGDLRHAQDAVRPTADSCFWIGRRGGSRI